MPEEVMAIAITAIIAASITVMSIAKAIARSVQAKARAGEAGENHGLTKSELRSLLRDAVEEATLPLYAQMQVLERKLDKSHPQLEAARRPPLPLDVPPEEEPERIPVARRER